MYTGLKYFIAFTLGAAAGAVVSWQLLKRKYEQIADDEIASIKEVYYSGTESKNEDEGKKPEVSTADVKEYAKVLSKTGYTKYSNTEKEEKPTPKNKSHRVITPEEFGDNDYDIVNLTYYADGVVTNDDDEALSKEDIEELIGEESLNYFGEYEDDSVHVRNDGMQTDYEILRDVRKYTEVFPHKVGD